MAGLLRRWRLHFNEICTCPGCLPSVVRPCVGLGNCLTWFSLLHTVFAALLPSLHSCRLLVCTSGGFSIPAGHTLSRLFLDSPQKQQAWLGLAEILAKSLVRLAPCLATTPNSSSSTQCLGSVPWPRVDARIYFKPKRYPWGSILVASLHAALLDVKEFLLTANENFESGKKTLDTKYKTMILSMCCGK